MRTKIVIIGAGKSSGALIKYLGSRTQELNIQLHVADINIELARQKINGFENCEAIALDISNQKDVEQLIQSSFALISMLPAHMHFQIARLCIKHNIHLLTASYLSSEMKALSKEADEKGLLFLNEMGLDPGIDHMSAMHLIDGLKSKGAKITSFQSFTGGLISEEDCDNPWKYKFTWNPRNVILAGQSTATYLHDGKVKYVPYQHLFKQIKSFSIHGAGAMEGYMNRDSLSYIPVYGLDHIKTMIRGTLRYEGFCKAWNVFVYLGLTDNVTVFETQNKMTYRQWLDAFTPEGKGSLEDRLYSFCKIEDDPACQEKIKSTGVFEENSIPFEKATSAEILQSLLEPRWKLQSDDRDLIVMLHQFEYHIGDKKYQTSSSLVIKGENAEDTAMAKTVGLPLAIACKLLIKGELKHSRGVCIPVTREIYVPVLNELEEIGISFSELTDER
ncbi:MAG TPA: saccharopine dehydrogenase C-terminal domain-containing protein [Bacteroidia bacterium]|nr:saccharopine dehydrogenase C-terminal domain-containing protein [Bacteroidia bacterium]